jgi:hypothetical protein
MVDLDLLLMGEQTQLQELLTPEVVEVVLHGEVLNKVLQVEVV